MLGYIVLYYIMLSYFYSVTFYYIVLQLSILSFLDCKGWQHAHPRCSGRGQREGQSRVPCFGGAFVVKGPTSSLDSGCHNLR